MSTEIAGMLGLDHADSVALLRRQTEMLELIADGRPLTDVLTGIAATLEELVPECRCSVLLLDPLSATLHHGAAPSLPDSYSAGVDGMAIGADAGSCGTAAYLGLAVVAEDIDTDPRWVDFRDLARRHDLRACWSTPIRGRSGVLGTFAVYHARTHRPSRREQRLVAQLTHLASVAIEHDRLFGALAESEERFRRAFEDNAIGMALTDLDRALVRVNGAMRELLGRTDADLIGADLDTLFKPILGTGPAGEPRAHYEATAETADGRTLDLAVAISPVRGAAGVPVHLSVNVLDVTQRRAAEGERRRRQEAEFARTAAEVASRAKSDFVSALGHELRTPLQAITGFTELLGTLDLPPERRMAALEHIGSASAHILAMVDDVLDVARIEAGALPVQLTDVALGPLVADVLAMLEPLAAAERVRVRCAAADVVVRADGRRLKQVLLNLVGNAIRYNQAGGTVLVCAAPAGGDVVVTVRDSGVGIAEEHLDRLFTPFDRLGADRDEGVGLGLPLARGLVEAMAGRLQVDSTADVGTTVTVTLAAVPAR
ncbi:ATP-binding protein [Actinokineospora sp.]|uniref:ATP-binding protein n=1 Tax=Actinokineospora sp. TaxID=1872133 RepID=UPI0040379FC9